MTRADRLGARTVDYLELIGTGKSFSVPKHQRDYSWTREEWDHLWSDFTELRSTPDGSHYMGAVVVQAETDLEFTVIDGQQRLATLTLFALAVTKTLRTIADLGLEPEANRSRAQLLHDRFVGEKHPVSLVEASRLALNETDNGFYLGYLVQGITPPNLRARPQSNRQIWDCYSYFLHRLTEIDQYQRDGEALASFLSRTVGRRLSFLLVTVSDVRNAYTVFETLNARGVRLTTTDLLKNHVFAQIQTPGDLDALRRYWRALLGSVESERFPDFLRYHLLSRHAMIRGPNLFELIREEFRTPRQVFDLVKQLESRAELFAALTDPWHEYWREIPEARPLIRELLLFGGRQMTPLLFTVWERFSHRDFVRVLKTVSTISFRHNIVSALSRGELESVYSRAAKAVADGEVKTPAAVFRSLRPIYIDDEKTREDFAQLAIETRGAGNKVVRYILVRLEADASGRLVDPDSDPGTIEHILPENPGGESWEEFPEGRREAFLYRIGNLTLLERRANRDLANRPFPEKVVAYGKSDYALTRQVAEISRGVWTPEQLEKRQRRLAERAVQIWRSDFA